MYKLPRSPHVFVVVATLALLSACGPSALETAQQARIEELETQLSTSETNRQGVETRLAEIESANAAMTERLRAMGQDVEQLQTERGNLQSSLDETRRALEELRTRERQAQERLQTFRGMLERFRAMIASGRLRVRITRNRMVVELQENILFDSGKAELKPEGQQALAEVAQVLSSIPNREFQIAGHTDNLNIRTRQFPSNWELSTTRAVTVLKFLVDSGVAAPRLSATGHADTQPVAPNETAEGRQQNRRIEIVLMPNLDELPDLSSLEAVVSP